MDRIFRNQKLKGIISKKAIEEWYINGDSPEMYYRGHWIVASLDDNEDVTIDCLEDGEPAGGMFDDLGYLSYSTEKFKKNHYNIND